jgi:hydrogenase nickel incorporation protein HypA/HybF
MRTVAQYAEGRKIVAVTVDVGPLAGVSADALDFCAVETAKEMGLGEPRIKIQQVPVVFKCSCGREYQAVDPLEACPSCGGYGREIVSGMDVVIREVELEDTK